MDEGLAYPGCERSIAAAGMNLYLSPPASDWPKPVPVHILAGSALAYQNIHQDVADGGLTEGILSFVLRTGAEFKLPRQRLARAEDEFNSTASDGPS